MTARYREAIYRLEEFEILGVLGEGSYGAVYLARDHRLLRHRSVTRKNVGAAHGRD